METLPPKPPTSFAETLVESIGDLDLIGAARELYQTYLQVHESKAQEPVGVILHRSSYRGKLLFRGAPILLPEERFVPLQQVRSRNRN